MSTPTAASRVLGCQPSALEASACGGLGEIDVATNSYPWDFLSSPRVFSARILFDTLHEIPVLCALLSMRMAMTSAKRAAWHEGGLEVKPTKLLYRGAPSWRKHKLISKKLGKLQRTAWRKPGPTDWVRTSYVNYLCCTVPTVTRTCRLRANGCTTLVSGLA